MRSHRRLHSLTALAFVSLVALPSAFAQTARAATSQSTQQVPPAPAAPRSPRHVEIVQHRGDTILIDEHAIQMAAEQAGASAEAAQAMGQAAEERGRDAEEQATESQARAHEMMGDLSGSRALRRLKLISSDPQGVHLPPADSIMPDDFTVATGVTRGRIASLGQLEILGTVNGDAVAIDGDVVVRRGGHVTGDAVSVGGSVQLDGGQVDGEMRSIDKAVSPVAVTSTARSGFLLMLDEMQTVMGWLVMMVILGFGVMVLAEDRLRVVTETIEGRFGKSVLTGLLAEVSFIPTLIIVPVLLVITIIGIVIAPFAALAIIVLGAGLATLGFLAMARVAGQAMTRRASAATARGVEMRAMLAGLCLFFGLWLLAAVLGWVPVLGTILHALAVVVTWAAATVGLGAAVISRGGSRRRVSETPVTPALPEAGWQTPTPISGIAAARRPATTTPDA
jgi:hypothetical protein